MTIAIVLTLQEDQCDTITFVDYHFNTIVILLSETFMKIYNMVRLFNTYGYQFLDGHKRKISEYCQVQLFCWNALEATTYTSDCHLTFFLSLCFVCLFVWFDSLCPINKYISVKQGRVFLGWTSTKLGCVCLAQGPQHSDAGCYSVFWLKQTFKKRKHWSLDNWYNS